VFQECAERGEDYHRVKLLDIGAEDAARWEKKKKKKNPDPGFSGRPPAHLATRERREHGVNPSCCSVHCGHPPIDATNINSRTN